MVGVAFKSLLYQALSLHSCYFVTTFLPRVVLFWVTYSVSSRNYFGVLNSAQLVCVPSVERGWGGSEKGKGVGDRQAMHNEPKIEKFLFLFHNLLFLYL